MGIVMIPTMMATDTTASTITAAAATAVRQDGEVGAVMTATTMAIDTTASDIKEAGWEGAGGHRIEGYNHGYRNRSLCDHGRCRHGRWGLGGSGHCNDGDHDGH